MPTISDFFPTLPNNFIYTLVLPFIILFAIFWGLLSSLRLFNSKINTVLAAALTLTLFFTGGFDVFTNFLFQSTTTLAAVIFILVFIFGLINWAVGRSRDIYYESGGYGRKIERLQKEIAKLRGKLETESDDKKKKLITRHIIELQEELKVVQEQQKSAMGD